MDYLEHPAPFTAEEIKALRDGLDTTARCALPSCTNQICFRPHVRGRRPRHCSGRCRAEYSRNRISLHRTWARLKRSADLPKPPMPVKEIEQVMDHVKWLLEAYGGFDKYLAFRLVPPRDPVPLESVFSYLDIVTDEHLRDLAKFVLSVAAHRRGETVLVDPDTP